MTRNTIRFIRRGKVVEVTAFPPSRTLLDYLRLDEKSRGTKEGCNEGDCGACTVVLGRLRGGRVFYEPVNACIQLLGQIDGTELISVEDLAAGGSLHPVQQALVDHHGSQCGFCTPGIAMSLFALYHHGEAATRQDIVDQLAGNLCRCTGYRPIIDAAQQVCDGKASDRWSKESDAVRTRLAALQDDTDIVIGDADSFFAAPASGDSVAAMAARHPDATILAGATDVALWITKQMRILPKIIHLGRVAALHRLENHPDRLSLGAAVTYAEAEAALSAIDPDIAELLRRLGSKQVRVSGTIGGNIANGSPIGDMPPILIALGASLTLRYDAAWRMLPLEDFFVAYGKQDRQPGELVWRIDVPKLQANEAFRCYKISKRFDQDISAVMGAFKIAVENNCIANARIAFGGMAATPKRALATERALVGLKLTEPDSWSGAIAALGTDYQPIGDMRASADYRRAVAHGLLQKALSEIAGELTERTRVLGQRERQVVA
ncbi:xanthine dehydrogenase small subunit [Dongia soli]|uniref:Xanthine dehydrogenase small subunit n=1 Tax=Dongia soli TaxID=600628 RepID=A0ABU5E5L3_9PROT|nr:xanthine dehydrogenase small subunit [Dongia soli]MDY0881612.1 xanthine dehydrogenase small subunit [Dongia soli]